MSGALWIEAMPLGARPARAGKPAGHRPPPPPPRHAREHARTHARIPTAQGGAPYGVPLRRRARRRCVQLLSERLALIQVHSDWR